MPFVCDAVGLLILFKLCPAFTCLQQLVTKGVKLIHTYNYSPRFSIDVIATAPDNYPYICLFQGEVPIFGGCFRGITQKCVARRASQHTILTGSAWRTLTIGRTYSALPTLVGGHRYEGSLHRCVGTDCPNARCFRPRTIRYDVLDALMTPGGQEGEK